MKNLFGYFLIFVSFVLILYAIFLNTNAAKKNQTFSSYTFLSSSWEKYRDEFINQDGRVVDYSQNGITTSEAQSYALLRSVFIGDKKTFDKVWNWTRNNLKRPQDNLFGWRWGKKANNSYGFESSSDMNSATDADTDIAFALLLASKRWKDDSYKNYANPILQDIWKFEVVDANGKKYITAGNWANTNPLIINLSYFSPYAYRYFSEADKKHDWNILISDGYQLLENASNSPLDKTKSVGLPPDWIALDTHSGTISTPNISNFTTNYSYEAIRIPWRIGLDFYWNHSEYSKKYLTKHFTFLENIYKKDGKLAGVYAHDGRVVQKDENPTLYATALAFMEVLNPSLAKKMYQEKIVTLYSNDTNSFNQKIPYYEQNWLWFGSALYNKQISKF